MNRHQVLTGACNPGENCYASGSVEGIQFTAYAAGCNIVILASDFVRVQIIPGVVHGNVKVTCVDCSTDTGKIAASYGKNVYIFESSAISNDNPHKLADYHWSKTADIGADCCVNSLSWNMEGCKLLTGGEVIQIWQFVPQQRQLELADDVAGSSSRHVNFHLGDFGLNPSIDDDLVRKRFTQAMQVGHGVPDDGDENGGLWDCVWKCMPASPVYHLQYSPDGFLFASAGLADRVVKIWFEDLKVQHGIQRMDSLSPRKDGPHYSFIYIAHPRAVTGFTWRQTSKYMPRGCVPNMIITSCMDKVSRVWVETILPDDGLDDMEQIDPECAPSDPKRYTHRHKKRFLRRLSKIRHVVHKRHKPHSGLEDPSNPALPTSVSSVHDFHRFALLHNGVSPILHFHLAGSINPLTDLPLLSVVGSQSSAGSFRLHWLNNKELQFTMEAERLLQELHANLQPVPDPQGSSAPDCSVGEDEAQDGDTEAEGKQMEGMQDIINHEKLRQNRFSDASLMAANGANSSKINPACMENLEQRIEVLLNDWHNSCDMLFAVHPDDGSFLVWLVDWLDECLNVSFRQAQFSFSSRLPKMFPIHDASSMASNVLLACSYSRHDVKSLYSGTNPLRVAGNPVSPGLIPGNLLIPNVLLVTKHHNGSLNQWQVSFTDKSKFQTVVSVVHAGRACGHRFRANCSACHPVLPLLLTSSHHNVPDCHDNGDRAIHEPVPVGRERRTTEAGSFAFCSELILWQVGHVGPLSKGGGLVELARVNSPSINAFTGIAWVPTLLPSSSIGAHSCSQSALFVASDGCSLRLYQAVIDARHLLATKHSSKTSATEAASPHSDSSLSMEESVDTACGDTAKDFLNIVSLQSSARPGCIIELDAITDATADWQNIQLLHVFQESMVTGSHGSVSSDRPDVTSRGLDDAMAAYVDLSRMLNFDEHFYLVVLERLQSQVVDGGSRLHMWRLTVSLQTFLPTGVAVTADDAGGLVTDDCHKDNSHLNEESDIMSRPSQIFQKHNVPSVTMSITTVKVCSQTLSLPCGTSILSASVAAGHLSSASIYPACFAPYLLTTACSDGRIRFWRCIVQDVEASMCHDNCFSSSSYQYPMAGHSTVLPAVTSRQEWKPLEHDYCWSEWSMMSSVNRSSAVDVPGKPLIISCAYSGRFAVAYRHGNVRRRLDNPNDKAVNLYVAIYECESSGGSEWVLENTIVLENIRIPDPMSEIDLANPVIPHTALPPGMSMYIDPFADALGVSATMPRSKSSVPSLSSLQSVCRSISELGNKLGLLKQKCLIQLDWMSTEDGSHVLTVGVGTKIFIYCQVSNEIAQASATVNSSTSHHRSSTSGTGDLRIQRPKAVQRSKSLAIEDFVEEIQWMRLRIIDLETVDNLPPLPMHITWVRGGILIVGLDNEIHVYTQWRGPAFVIPVSGQTSAAGDCDENESSLHLTHDKHTLSEANLASISCDKAMTKSCMSMSNISALATSIKPGRSVLSSVEMSQCLDACVKPARDMVSRLSLERCDGAGRLNSVCDFGLFEAVRLANPVLPQYHPEQLKVLLGLGKIRRVKVILVHLLNCIVGSDSMQAALMDDAAEESPPKFDCSKSLSGFEEEMDSSPGNLADDFELKEISFIPPLPLYALLEADSDASCAQLETTNGVAVEPGQGYNDLFLPTVVGGAPPLSDRDDHMNVTPPIVSSVAVNQHSFTPVHSKLMSKLLLRISLPGLSSLDQMYLVAMADTVAHCRMDFADRFTAESKQGSFKNDSDPDVNQAAGSLDDCGLRFVLEMRQHIYLLSTLPHVNRFPLQRQGLKSSAVVWAFHSETPTEILSMIPCVRRDEPVWEELRQFGVGWWLTNITHLRSTMERVAKFAFQREREPMDAAIFYLAMRKKNIMAGLYRTVRNQTKVDFFRKDFTQPDAARQAKKNAFHLMSRQKFMDSAALFLLAGSLDDAIMVILEKMNDFQLALVVCRLYEVDAPLSDSVRRLLYVHILGRDRQGDNYDASAAHRDPFLRSMAFWLLKEYQCALDTLLEDHAGFGAENSSSAVSFTGPNIFSFYNYLRTHPLLMKLRLSSSSLKKRRSILTGFTRADSVADPDRMLTIDRVTLRERKLFFATAQVHLKNGCPLLALEVMTRLPPTLDGGGTEDECQSQTGEGEAASSPDPGVGFYWKPTSPAGQQSDKSNAGLPVLFNSAVSNVMTADDVDWSVPVARQPTDVSDTDWSLPVSNQVRFEEQEFHLGETSMDDYEDEDEASSTARTECDTIDEKTSSEMGRHLPNLDIMAQQFKHIACLKVLMEEFSALGASCEVDGGQLRYHTFVWLEKEANMLRLFSEHSRPTDVAAMCEDAYPAEDILFAVAQSDSSLDSEDDSGPADQGRYLSQRPDSAQASLHEHIFFDNCDLDFKERRLAKRRHWLRQNEHFLLTLASFCILQEYNGVGLAPVHMELILLLQELQRHRSKHHLHSPLPLPTTLPILTTLTTSSATITADPVQFLTQMTSDLLHTVTMFTSPPSPSTSFKMVMSMSHLAVSLSSCLYQCLCDSDTFSVGADSLAPGNASSGRGSVAGAASSVPPDSALMHAASRRPNNDTVFHSAGRHINTAPARWPGWCQHCGVASLLCLLLNARDDDVPNFPVLLVQSLLAVYLALLVNGLACHDSSTLYRLLSNKLDQLTWGLLLGGGCRTAVAVQESIPRQDATSSLERHRHKLNWTVMGFRPPPAVTSIYVADRNTSVKETYTETFVPPEFSTVSYLMTKPFVSPDSSVFNYDSEASLDSEDDFENNCTSDDDDELDSARPKTLGLDARRWAEHSDPNSFSWCLMRHAVLRAVLFKLRTFLPVTGIELSELPSLSPKLHSVLRHLENWESMTRQALDAFSSPPNNYISGINEDTIFVTPISKMEALLHSDRSPFINTATSLPVKRLWFFLLQQEHLQEVFLRYIYKRPRVITASDDELCRIGSSGEPQMACPVKIVYKEQETITSFAINQFDRNLLVLATPNKLMELDVRHLLHPPGWMSEDNEYDIESIRNPINATESMPEFLAVQMPHDAVQSISGAQTLGIPCVPAAAGLMQQQQAKLGSKMPVKRTLPGIVTIASHPTFQCYLTGSLDGSVRLWEWGHQQAVSTLRPPDTLSKVTKVMFNAHGNKCCVSEVDGSVLLWQIGQPRGINNPFGDLACHDRTTSDFSFVGCSSVIATAGHSTDNRNVCMWDTLLPSHNDLIHGFCCHKHGTSAIVYSPHNQTLISGGRKGDICHIDVRQRRIRNTFQAHDCSIKCLAVDSQEQLYVTGSTDGDIKVWCMQSNQLNFSFVGEHCKNSFFRSVGQSSGVTQVLIDDNQILSCGADGSLKFRKLPDKDTFSHR